MQLPNKGRISPFLHKQQRHILSKFSANNVVILENANGLILRVELQTKKEQTGKWFLKVNKTKRMANSALRVCVFSLLHE